MRRYADGTLPPPSHPSTLPPIYPATHLPCYPSTLLPRPCAIALANP
ncbi:MAG: hypothetical protein AAF609_15945 [Cyanobacteria bacterium P01_C01_bin.120]